MSIESKLDRIIELLEKLVPKSVVLNSPISVKNEVDKDDVSKDINKLLYEVAEKISRRHPPQGMSNKEFNRASSDTRFGTDRLTKVLVDSEKAIEKNKDGIGKEEFVNRLKEVDWDKTLRSKIKIDCKDEKGEIFTLDGNIQEDGSIICDPMKETRTIVGWGLIDDVSKEVVPAVSNKNFITRTIDVFKQQVDTNMFVYVGTITDNVLTLNQSATVLETHIVKPTTYFVDWFVKNTNPAIGCEWINVYPSNNVNDILVREKDMTNFVTTGYLTKDGKAVYYDQYL